MTEREELEALRKLNGSDGATVTIEPFDISNLQREPRTDTTPEGVMGAITRGLAPIATGAAVGAALGAPLGGVGAIPGGIAGAGAAALTQMLGDPIISSVNSLLGTKYSTPSDAMEDLLTRVGVPEAKTAAERIVQTMVAGAGGGVGATAVGRAMESAISPVTRGIGQALASAPALSAISSATGAGAGQLAKEEGAGTLGQLGATVAGGLVPAVPSMVKSLTQQAAKQIAPPGAGITEKVEPTFVESVQSIKATIGEKISPQDQLNIKKVIADTPDSTDVVNFRLSGTQVVPDNQAASTLKQGWKDGAIASIKAATPRDREAMLEMLDKFKKGEKSESYKALNRPADVLGETVQSRINFLDLANKSSGKAIDRIAQSRLKGQTVDYDPAINSFIKDLDNIGVKVELDSTGLAKANLDNSRIQGDVAGEKLLNIILQRLSKTTTPDALRVHEAKRFIDTQVNYGKRNLNNPLTAEAERIVKGLRRNLNQTLGEKFPVYKAANEKYADTITALDDLQKAAGTSIDFDSPNANKALGTAMRKLTSNYATRVNLIDALDQANMTAGKYGMKLNDDITNQLIFTNELDRMFGAAAQTSLKGQQAEALATGVDIARGRIAQRAIELASQAAENLRGVNKDNAVKSMEELLKRKP